MKQEYQIVNQVLLAQTDSQAADEFIRQHLPFIKAETARFTHRIPQEGVDEELSIAMFAFYEAMMAYEPSKGAFIKLAALSIKNRLIDFTRREKRHTGLISYDQPLDSGEDGATMLDTLADENNELEERQLRAATREEILEFSGQLAGFGLSLSDVADSCPKQERTLKACVAVLDYAREHPELLEQLVRSKKLPLAALAQGSGVERKTLERHRDYVVAILLAFTNGFEIIRGHLYQLQRKEVRGA